MSVYFRINIFISSITTVIIVFFIVFFCVNELSFLFVCVLVLVHENNTVGGIQSLGQCDIIDKNVPVPLAVLAYGEIAVDTWA